MKNHLFIPVSLIIVLSIFSYSCKSSIDLNPNTVPTASFVCSPTIADTSTIITFDASASFDDEDKQDLLTYSWDFEGNLNWTTPTNSPVVFYQYSNSGTYDAALKVLDAQGWSGGTTSTIIVSDSI